jgi:hypothetical protein
MYARRFFPMLMLAGAVMMFMRHNRNGFAGQCEEGEKRSPIGPHERLHGDLHGEWGKRVPPLVEKWHKQLHEQEAPTPAI